MGIHQQKNITKRITALEKKLAVKNRELEIEASLERVRARAVAMHSSNELADASDILFQELEKLNIDVFRTGISIIDDAKNTIEVWSRSWVENSIAGRVNANIHPVFKKMLKAWRKKQTHFSATLKGSKVKEYYETLTLHLSYPKQKKYKEQEIITTFFFSEGSLNVMSAKPLNEETCNILIRFARVFGQMYRRFLDLQKAEAQAREAQIEAALERIRARALAMHNSNELIEIPKVLREQMALLGQPELETSVVHLYEEDPDNILSWRAFRTGTDTNNEVTYGYTTFPKNSCEFVREWLTNFYSDSNEYTIEISGAKQKEWYKVLFKFAPDVINAMRKTKSLHEKRYHQFSKFSGGALLMVSKQPPSEESVHLQKRAAAVFDLAYRRFLDLKKAEAQAREAMIEAALERVRARSMAMHHSHDMHEVINVVNQQLQQLGFLIHATNFVTDFEEGIGFNMWLAKPGETFPFQIHVPSFEHPVFKWIREEILNGKTFLTYTLTFEEKNMFFKHLLENTSAKNISEQAKKEAYDAKGMAASAVVLQKVILTVLNYDITPYTDEENTIIKRFGKVFEQSYIRFLDLQKAEAQAREAHIEAGLERVRSRAMAMQSSEELNALIGTVFTELTKLDLVLTRCVIWVFDPATDSTRWWMANSEEPSNPMNFLIKYHEHPAYLTFLQEWKKQNVQFVYDLKGQDKISWDDILFNETELVNLPDVVKNGMRTPERVLLSASFNNFGGINVASLEPLTDEHFDILLRFAKVFDLTYTRFNDLKQAEAQTKESRIQLALERVRARTMAMQRSDELMDTAVVLFNQLNQLGENIERTIIGVMNEEERVVDIWATRPDGSEMGKVLKFPIDEPIVMQKVYAAWQQQKKSIVIDLQGEELENYFRVLKARGPRLKRENFGERRVESFAFFSKGILGVINVNSITPANVELYERFAAVFDQTYTRFLDLQKAEAQAKEAQIEAALERVRSRSMAMHKSDELLEVINVVSEQLQQLNIRFGFVCFGVTSPHADLDFWMASPGFAVPEKMHMPYVNNPVTNSLVEARKNGLKFFANSFTAEEMREWMQVLFDTNPASQILTQSKEAVLAGPGLARSSVLLKDINVFLGNFGKKSFTDEQNAIVIRFANVFEQSYTRFLDLQKAEAQAREAQIEAALERVRARAMAMHTSGELKDIAHELRKQLALLGTEELETCAINLYEESEMDVHALGASRPPGSENEIAEFEFWFPKKGIVIIEEIMQAYFSGVEEFVVHVDGEKASQWLQVLSTIAPNIFNIVDESTHHFKETGNFRAWWKTCVFFRGGCLIMITMAYPGDESRSLIKRVAQVFGIAYRRFLDLQKAEAQAKESQIQLALERVRARTMAMQKSDELLETSFLLFQQVRELGETAAQVSIGIINEEAGFVELSTTIHGHHLPHTLNVPINDPYVMAKAVAAWKAKRKLLTVEIEGQELKNYNEHRNSFFETKINFPEDQWIVNLVFFSKGWLSFSSDKDISGETFELLKRFAAVFEQTYIRFNDLKQAEEQAREARIEAALEKVRSRTMAMQHSNELSETASLLFDQLNLLGEKPERTFIGVINEPEHVIEIWATQHGGTQMDMLVEATIDEPYVMNRMYKAWKEQKRSITIDLKGEELESYFQFLKRMGAPVKREIFGERRLENIAFFSKGMLGIITTEPATTESIQLYERFANVFDLTYTRFLDLKQAEAQARESQIQLALERVRARTMAMQKSDELAETAAVLFQQLISLEFKLSRSFICFFKNEGRQIEMWTTTEDGNKISAPFLIEAGRVQIFQHVVEEWKQKKEFFELELQGENLQAYFDYLHDELNIPFNKDQEKRVMTSAFFSNGYIGVSSAERQPEEIIQLLRRFASVFDLTYTRFLDLQKAEAQAREGQIQLALERVRARTMAMHKSEELAETAQVMFQQLNELGGVPDRISIGIADETNGFVNFWSTDQLGSHIDKSFKARLNEPIVISKTYQAWKEHKKSLVIDLHGEELKQWIKFAREEMGIIVKDENIHDRRVHHLAFFSHGWILVTTHEPQSPETIHILERFASVFNLTYRRFLDLQKAEAQAREAQIEAALEKVRSRSLAMHKSDELQEVVNTVFERLQELNIEMDSCNIAIFNEGTRDFEFWIASPFQKKTASFRIAGDWDFPIIQNLLHARESGQDFFSECFSFDEKNKWFNFAFQNTDFSRLPPERQQYVFGTKAYALSIAFSKNTGVQINNFSGKLPSDKEIEILKRFSKVFEQAYIRFLDLEKAEAQAREAQIEIALERVRSRSMGMQKSDELAEVVAVLYKQFEELDFGLYQVLVSIYDKKNTRIEWWSRGFGEVELPQRNNIPIVDHPFCNDLMEKWGSGVEYYPHILEGEMKRSWDDYLFTKTDLKNFPQAIKDTMKSFDKVYLSDFFMKYGSLQAAGPAPLPGDKAAILKRFVKVLDLAYTRMTDLQNAEAQARESRIQLALERVRARTMAMQKSEELSETSYVLFQQFNELGEAGDQISIGIFDEEEEIMKLYSTFHGSKWDQPARIEYSRHAVYQRMFAAWKDQKKSAATDLAGSALQDFNKFKLTIPGYRVSEDELAKDRWVVYTAFFSNGLLSYASNEPRPKESVELLERFASVFDLTYTRFLDLKRAEAQAREAQIEASLERVRSKTMAMHNSQDVADTVATMFDELVKLEVETIRCGIAIIHNIDQMEVWTANPGENGKVSLTIGNLGMTIHPMLLKVHDSWKNKESYTSYELVGEALKDYFRAINNAPNYPIRYTIEELPYRQMNTAFYFPEGCLFAFTAEKIPAESSNILKRFAGVFGQTYRRYLDLQKAEANTREAQIEAGLERVRARTMAMHSSDDVGVATATMFTELEKLGIDNLRGGITIIRPDQTQEVWSVTNMADGKTVRAIGVFDMKLHPLWRALFEGKEREEDYQYYWMAGQDKQDYINILNATPNYLTQPIKEFPDLHVQSYFFGEGAVWTNSLQPHSEEDKQVMKRFASVFSLTFRRYQDLRKAEAQAREATVEAALEKVRGKAMAMHNSNDLSVTTSMIISELRKLGISPIRCGVGIISKETNKAQLYTATASADGDSLSVVGWVLLKGHPVLENIYEKWAAGEDYFPELSGNSRKAYYEQLLAGLSVPLPDFKDEQKHYGHFFAISVGCLYAWADVKYNDDEIKILKRFASIIDLTFRRYFELQKSEASAREAVKQAALDRVRAEIASMRTVTDLERITPLIWNELTILGVPFIRCGVFLMDDSQQLIHTFLSTPEGKAIAAFHLPYDTPGNLGLVVSNWKDKTRYIGHWNENEFYQFAEILVREGALDSAENYLKTIPQGGFYLHFLPFLQGMLYVGNTEQLNDEQIELIQHVADAFSTAYARYEDFNKLEAAKQQVEKTLTDLKQAQQQLVQSEKMASLGELTAGIAHEIQNPLNFVNNFSDVSNELLDEMKDELAKGNLEDALAIAEDVKQNLEKINHHGKRADGIVKGMLQHSRTSSGQKEPTDINVLADEYLRLAFHGLRAKDKSFNAKFETDFDNSIGKINVMPQDMGRVILNLINNAFYAVSEKKKRLSNGYEPTVTVITKKIDDKILVTVKDNGNGIPQKVLDKIFQPFFTTKPTGQGTGLGLSLAYDIITKGHGGELKVETKEGDGSQFIIRLPSY